MMSFVAETFIFLYVGMDALDMEKWKMTRLRCLIMLPFFLQNWFTSVYLVAYDLGFELLVSVLGL